MEIWSEDTDAQPPVKTQGMCPLRPGTGEDPAYSVNQAYVVNMPSYVEGKLHVDSLLFHPSMPTEQFYPNQIDQSIFFNERVSG